MSWTHDEVVATVKSVVPDHVETGVDRTEKTELAARMGVDALGGREVVQGTEDRLDTTIGDKELRGVATLGDVTKAIEARLREDGRLKG